MIRIPIAGSAVFTALTLVAGPALADSQRPADEPKPATRATPAPAASNDKRYCVADTVTGTRIARKVCKTRDAWMRDNNFDPLDP